MPKQLRVTFMLSVLLVSTAFCENSLYYLEINFPTLPKKQISIGSYYGKSLLVEGIINLDSEGKGAYHTINHNGIYVLLMPDSSSYEFMITGPDEYQFYLTSQRISISANPATEVYTEFYNHTKETRITLDYLTVKSSLSSPEEKKLIELKIKKEKNTLDSLTRKIALEYRGNLVGDYCNALLPVKMPVTNSVTNDSTSWLENINYYRNHYLDNINWMNPDLIYTQILEEKILTYIEKIAPQKQAARAQAIDTLFSRAEGADMTKFIANTLLNKFQNNLQESLSEFSFVYLVSEYIFRDSVPDIAPQLRIRLSNKVKLLQPSMIGEKAYIFNLPEENGNYFTLAGNNSLTTVLLFWDYSCPSCTRILKNFRQVLNQYKQENIQVVTIFTGQDHEIWQAWVHENLQKNWANTYLGKNSEILKIYNITHTPTIYLLDPSLTIADKNISVQELDKFLSKIVETKN